MTNFLYFNSRDEFDRIDIARIICFQSDGNYTNVVLTNKVKVVLGISLSKMEKHLSDSLKDKARCFVRVGKSCIINVNFILRINVLKQYIVLTDYDTSNYQVSISKDALKKLKDIMVSSVKNQTNKQ